MTSMVNLSWLPPIFAQASERLVSNLGELAGGATVWLAVTGLSRSGKTVFITSLIHNLLSSLHNPNRMPLLGVVGERRLIAANLEGAKAHRLPRFPYLDNIEKMADPGLAAAHRRYQRDRHRGPFRARRRARPAAERDHRQPRELDPPDRRLSRRVAARPAAAGAELCRVVARDAALAAQGRARRDRTRFSRPARPAPARREPRARRRPSARTISTAPICSRRATGTA